MAFQIIVAQRAENDLLHILEYLDTHWPESVSESFLEAYETRLNLLREMPWLYPITERRPGVRRCLIGKQTALFYQVHEEAETVEVLAVRDTRSDPDQPAAAPGWLAGIQPASQSGLKLLQKPTPLVEVNLKKQVRKFILLLINARNYGKSQNLVVSLLPVFFKKPWGWF